MRLFTAVDLPDPLLDTLERLIHTLEPKARIKWSPRSKLHITTKFIGHWPDEKLEEIKAALAGVPGREAMPIRIRGLGYFPNPHSPRVFWAGIEAPPGLAALAKGLDDACAALGIEPEKRAFSPHLTLARIKEPVPMQPLREAVAALPSLDFGNFIADRFYLYQSRLNPKGSIYEKIGEFPFAK